MGHWLHNDMHCCHLDLNLKNIMLENAEFIHTESGESINQRISAKLCDFGRSELFEQRDKDMFECHKDAMSLYGQNGIYDARVADVWDFGMMLIRCCVGIAQQSDDTRLDTPMSATDTLDTPSTLSPTCSHSGLDSFLHTEDDDDALMEALRNDQMKKYLSTASMKKKIANKRTAHLLLMLLGDSSYGKCQIINILQHDWFAAYFQRYKKRIFKKSRSQQKKLKEPEQIEKLKAFPYYNKNE